jgi:hypothetical protein
MTHFCFKLLKAGLPQLLSSPVKACCEPAGMLPSDALRQQLGCCQNAPAQCTGAPNIHSGQGRR